MSEVFEAIGIVTTIIAFVALGMWATGSLSVSCEIKDREQ